MVYLLSVPPPPARRGSLAPLQHPLFEPPREDAAANRDLCWSPTSTRAIVVLLPLHIPLLKLLSKGLKVKPGCQEYPVEVCWQGPSICHAGWLQCSVRS